ncbi:hypothetical protein KXX18_009149, partial [Aspergillus fumigatus]
MAIDVQCQCEVVQPRAFGEDLGFPQPPPPACVSRRAAQSLNPFQIHDSSKYWQATIGLSRASQTDRVTAFGASHTPASRMNVNAEPTYADSAATIYDAIH